MPIIEVLRNTLKDLEIAEDAWMHGPIITSVKQAIEHAIEELETAREVPIIEVLRNTLKELGTLEDSRADGSVIASVKQAIERAIERLDTTVPRMNAIEHD